MQRLTMQYLVTYLTIGGVGLLLVPEAALRLLMSTGDYGDVMPRMAGMFMVVIAGFIVSFLRRNDFSYYTYTIIARTFIVLVLTALYVETKDFLFVVLDGIVLVGLVPSAYVRFASRGGVGPE